MKVWFLFASILVLFAACNKDEIQAEKSIEGNWKVVEITSYYGEFFSNGGFDPSETILDSGDLGSFNFSENFVDYSFTRNDTLFSGNGSWVLELEKVNQGFTKVNKFTLTIEGHFEFDVAFEDQTKNAEKNAKELTFMEYPTSGFGVGIELKLEKE